MPMLLLYSTECIINIHGVFAAVIGGFISNSHSSQLNEPNSLPVHTSMCSDGCANVPLELYMTAASGAVLQETILTASSEQSMIVLLQTVHIETSATADL